MWLMNTIRESAREVSRGGMIVLELGGFPISLRCFGLVMERFSSSKIRKVSEALQQTSRQVSALLSNEPVVDAKCRSFPTYATSIGTWSLQSSSIAQYAGPSHTPQPKASPKPVLKSV